ncbi:MAG TPA: hypothetical protein VG276_08540 [Actinomycetes bacterium]|nr:hypothetical protein [Actinomycetes bacterium]
MLTPDGGARAESGFTIAELMVTSAILLLIVTAALSILVAAQRSAGFSSRRGQTQDDVRLAMDRLTKDMRQLTGFTTSFASSSGCNVVDTSGSGDSWTGCDLDFHAYTVANPDTPVRVHWWVAGNALYREEFRPDGSSAGTATVLGDLTTPGGSVPAVFSCDVLQGSDAVTGAPVPWQMTVTLTIDLSDPGTTYSVRSQVQMRNLQIPQPPA